MGLRGPRSTPRHTGDKHPPKRRRLPWTRRGLRRVDRVIAFLQFLPVTKGIRGGKKLRLLPHQLAFVQAVYGDRSEVTLAIQSLPRGNGKTGLLAGLCLAHLVGPESEPRGEVYAAAIDRLQAGIMFNEVVAMIEAVPEFLARVNVQRFHKKVEVMAGEGAGSVFEALSADVRRGHGLSPSLFVYDEFAQAKTGELLDNLTTAQGKRRRSLGIVISTQAGDDLHPLSVLIDDAERGLDASLYVQRLSAPEDADPFAERTWRAVNPALGIFLDADTVRSEAERAKRMPTFEAKYRNLRLNQRVMVDERWLGPELWTACLDASIEVARLPGEICYGGLDLGSTRDLTAFALFWPESRVLKVWTWCPEETVSERERSDRAPYRLWAEQGYLALTPGRATDKRQVAIRLGELCAQYRPDFIAFDRWGFAELERTLKDEGVELRLKEFGQGFRDMAPATNAFEVRVLNQQLRHDGNPLLRWALGNVALERDAANNAKPNKRRSHDRIDPIVAAIMAVGLAARETVAAPPEYQVLFFGGRR